MQKEPAIRVKKHIAVFLHLAFLTLSVFGISMMYLNTHYGKGISMIHETKYEDSDEFAKQLQQDIDMVFQYVAYRDCLEPNGYLDMTSPMVTIRLKSDNDIVYTIDELVRHARTLGYYLDENYDIVQDPLTYTPPQEPEYYVVQREYDRDVDYAEPGDAYSTLKDLSLETLECLSGYYKSFERFFNQPANLYFQVYYEDTNGDRQIYSNVPDISPDAMKEMGRYCFLTGDALIMDSNLAVSPKNIAAYMENLNPYDSNAYYVMISIDTDYPAADVYGAAATVYNLLRKHYLEGLLYLVLGFLGLLVTLYYLTLVSGYRTARRDEPYLHSFDTISTEFCLILTAIATLFALFLGEKIGTKMLHLIVSQNNWQFAERMADVVIIYLCCLTGAFSLLRRYKSRQLWVNSMLRQFVRRVHEYITYQGSKKLLTLFYFGFVCFHLITCAAAILILINYRSYLLAKAALAAIGFLVLLIDLSCFSGLFKRAVQQDQLMAALDKIAGGDTAYVVNVDKFSDKEQLIAKRINSIGAGLESALSEKVKSERLKADLITNVSHDIKTPLTSIINYVDLIRREQIDNPRIQNYLDVLDQKSQRLKTLTEDLVEASKASSGNLKLDITDIDIIQLVCQTNGEFEEKFASRHLTLVANLLSESLVIAADGRQLWRVFENLYNNAYKYAMEHSRVYVDVTKEDDNVCFTIKNISQNPLNIRGDELTERFVRGDVSRSTEGSGLGLSIAQSLIALQKGQFQILIDGDLFKVLVTFPLRYTGER